MMFPKGHIPSAEPRALEAAKVVLMHSDASLSLILRNLMTKLGDIKNIVDPI